MPVGDVPETQVAAQEEERPERSGGGSAAIVSGATMCSRVLGLVRELLFAAIFGSTPFAAALKVGFLLPNLLRDMLGEGVLTAAYVPTFAARLKTAGKAEAFRFTNIVLGLVLVGVGAITLLGAAFAPQLVELITEFNEDYRNVAQDLTADAARILFPFLLFMSLAAVVMGTLNAQERYWIPAIAPAVHNLVTIAGGGYLVWSGLDVSRPTEGRIALLVWAGCLLLAGFTQLVIQLPELYRTGFRLRPSLRWRDPGVARLGRLMAPATVGLAALQVNIMVRYWFASQQDGAIPWLDYAFRVFYLPLGIFGVAVATICTTKLALQAAAKDLDGMRSTYDSGLRLVAFLTFPSMVGLVVLRTPVVRLLFERGQFTPEDTPPVAAALALFALGLYAYSAVKVTVPGFYALDRTRIPVIASISAVAVNIALSFILFPRIGYQGLAIGMSAAAIVNFLVLFGSFQRLTGGLDLGGLVGHGLRVLVASAFCGGTAWLVESWIAGALGTESVFAQAAAVGSSIVCGVGVYAAACRLLRVPELDTILAFARRTLGR